MKYLILLSLIFCINNCKAQNKNITDTLNALFYKSGRQINDTSYFDNNNSEKQGTGLARFFNKMLRAPEDSTTGKIALGKCKVFFILDKSGKATQIWYDKSSNITIALEVIRVINKMPILKPSFVNGNPVITKVELTVAIVMDDNNANKKDEGIADILMIAYERVYKKKVYKE